MTRSAAIGLACGLATLAVMSPQAGRRRWRLLGAVLLVLLVAAAVILPWLPGDGTQPPGAAAASVTDRFQLWRAGAAMVHDHPWFGVGPDGTRRDVVGYLDPGYRRPGVASHLHSAWLTLAAEGGLPLLAMVLLFYGRGLARGRSLLARGRESDLVLGVLAALAGFVAMGFFEDNFDDSEVFFVHMITLAAVWQRREGEGDAGSDAPT
jgi:O-antigen ligase